MNLTNKEVEMLFGISLPDGISETLKENFLTGRKLPKTYLELISLVFNEKFNEYDPPKQVAYIGKLKGLPVKYENNCAIFLKTYNIGKFKINLVIFYKKENPEVRIYLSKEDKEFLSLFKEMKIKDFEDYVEFFKASLNNQDKPLAGLIRWVHESINEKNKFLIEEALRLSQLSDEIEFLLARRELRIGVLSQRQKHLLEERYEELSWDEKMTLYSYNVQ